ncbi:uncharacterized protein LOC134177944 [Corticium candelabrum]|nr:uncharacterized protein LOC134177944 [Corticium candelabrum]
MSTCTGRQVVRTLLTTSNSFWELGVLSRVIKRLDSFGIQMPTEIQRMSIPPLLDGRSSVINAETGSGKTLCYVVPFVQRLYQLPHDGRRKPLGLFIVPSQELSYQVISVFNNLVAGTRFHLGAVCSSIRLVLRDDTVGIVGTVSSLANYHWPVVLKNIRYVVVDEADLLLNGQSSEMTWKLLNYFRSSKLKRNGDNLVDQTFGWNQQFVFCGATIPSGGKMAVQSVIERWFKQTGLLDHATFLSSSQAHSPVSCIDYKFVRVTENSKLSELVGVLDQISHDTQSSKSAKVLIFTNTLASCQRLHLELVDVMNKYPSCWWYKKLERYDKSVSVGNRMTTLQCFKDGTVQVLVCTDLASRGLDILNVQTVIQYDFPENSTAFLHRSGRTGRAGKQGKVVSFVSEETSELATLVQDACLKSNDLRSFEATFSRKRKLRRRLKHK